MQYFISSSACPPSVRWQEAFPEGRVLDASDLPASFESGAVIWLPVAVAQWQSLLAAVGRSGAGVAVVVVALEPEAAQALQALASGARGYCHAMAAPVMLREVALVVSHGGVWIGETLMSRLLAGLQPQLPVSAADDCMAGLSAREAEVAQAVACGLSNKEAAARLGISERTVKAHLGAIFEKFGVRDRLQLVLRLSRRTDAVLTE